MIFGKFFKRESLTLLSLMVSFFVLPFLVSAADWYVSPTATSNGLGTKLSPFNYQTVFSGGSGKIQPGDTVYFRGGVYGGNRTEFVVQNLRGTEAKPIILRPYPGEKATLDGVVLVNPSTYLPRVGYFWLVGFEMRNDRNADTDCVDVYFSDGVKLINNIIHDCGSNGIGFWSSAVNSEAYGNIIYYNGATVSGSTRGHGHGMYVQNVEGSKNIENNIIFKGMALGIQAYGSGKSQLKNVNLKGNVVFQAGSLYDPKAKPDSVLITNPNRAQGIVFEDNHIYNKPADNDGYTRLGYDLDGHAREGDIVAKGNYFIGGERAVYFRNWDQAVFQNNTIYATGSDPSSKSENAYVLDFEHLTDQALANTYNWDNNNYFGNDLFRYNKSRVSFEEFKKKTGLDKNSIFTHSAPKGVWTFVKSNKYDPGRGYVVVYNWDGKSVVEVDLKSLGLKDGENFEIKDVQNIYGAPVYTGTYNGKTISLSMNLTQISAPAPGYRIYPSHTDSDFSVFLVVPASSSVVIPPVTPDTTQSADIQGPSVELVYPVAGVTLKGQIAFNANATDASGIRSVQFMIDNKNFGSEDLAYPYVTAVDTTTLSNGQHSFSVIVTDNAGNKTYSSVSTNVSNESVTPTSPDNQNQNTQKWGLYLEAENAVLSNMKVSKDAAASAGSYIYTASANTGEASFSVSVPSTGTYYVWGRVLSPSSAKDSFTVSFGNNTDDTWDNAEKLWSNNWQWTRVTGRSQNGGLPSEYNALARKFNLSAGTNKLAVKGREVGAALDSLFVTNDSGLVPTQVLPAQNATTETSTSTNTSNTNQNANQSSTTPDSNPTVPATPSDPSKNGDTKIDQPVIRINAGGWSKDFVDSSGNTWQKDNYYKDGGLAYNTNYDGADFGLFATGRQGVYSDFSYNIPLANGSYTVKLNFVELYQNSVGARVFNVKMEGLEVLKNLDIFAEVGFNKPLVKSVVVNVNDGKLNIDFVGVKNRGIVSAIEVTPVVATAKSDDSNFWNYVASPIISVFKFFHIDLSK